MGFDTNEIIASIPDTLSLAAAGNVDLARAADIASNVMSGFNMMSGDVAANMKRTSDVISKAASSANTDVDQFGDAMSYTAPVAAAYGISLEESAAAVGIFSDAGIQGSRAGMTLKNTISTMAGAMGSADKKLKKFGLTMEDVNPETNDLVDIIAKLEDAGVTAADAIDLVGSEAGPGFAALLSVGSEGLREFTKDLEDAEGTAQKMMDIQTDNLGGDIQKLTSKWEAFKLALFFDKETELRGFVQKVTEILDKIIEKLPTALAWIKKMSPAIKGLAVAFGILAGVLATIWAFRKIANLFALMTSPIGLVVIAIWALSAAFIKLYQESEPFKNLVDELTPKLISLAPTILKVVAAITALYAVIKVISAFAKAIKGLFKVLSGLRMVGSIFTALLAVPPQVWAVIAVVVALGTTFYLLYKHSEKFRNFVNGIRDGFKDLYEVFSTKGRIGEEQMEGMTKFGQNMAEFKNKMIDFKEAVADTWSSIKEWFSDLGSMFSSFGEGEGFDMSKLFGDGKLGDVAQGLYDSLLKMKEKFNDFKDVVKEGWESLKETVGNGVDKVKDKWNEFADKMSEIKDKVTDVWDNIKEKGNEFKTAFIEIFEEIGNKLADFFEPVNNLTNSLMDFYSAVSELLVELGKLFTKIIVGVILATLDKFREKWNELKEAVSSFVEFVLEKLEEFGEFLEDVFNEHILPILEWFSNKWQEIKSAASGALDYIVEKWNELGEFLEEIYEEYIEPILQWFVEKWHQIKAAASSALEYIVDKWNELGVFLEQIYEEYIEPILQWFIDKWEDVKSTVIPILENLRDKLGEIGAKMKELWEKYGQPLVDWLEDKFNGAIEVASNIVEGFGKAFDLVASAIDWATEKVRDFTEAVKNVDIKLPSFGGGGGGKGHFFGITNVPYDGYQATLHKGETVITAQETRQLEALRKQHNSRLGGGLAGFTQTSGQPETSGNSVYIGDIHVHSNASNPKEVADEVIRRIAQQLEIERSLA